MAKPASQHHTRPPSTTASSSSNPPRRRPQHPSAPSPGVLAALAALVGTGTAGALPTERDVPDFLCPSLLASQAQVTTRDNEIEFAQTNTQPTPSTSCSETTTSPTPSSDQAYLQSSSPFHSPAEPWLVRADAALDENSISPRYRRLRRRRAKRASAQENGGGSKIRRDLPEHYARNIPDRYEQGDDGLWHKVEFYASCSRCQSDPHDVSTTSSDIGVDRDSSSGSTISAADSNTTTTTSALPSLKYPDNWVRQGGESGIYKVTIIVVMSLFIAAAVCCCIAIAVLWRRRRKRARQMARQRDLEKRRAVDGSDGEYDEMDEEGGSEAGCCERRLGESKEERRRRRKAELARLAQRDGDVEDDEEHREKKRWARASARWKSHVRWIRRRRTGNKRILESMMQRDAAASSVSVFSPSLHGNDTSVDAGDSLRDSSLARRRPVVGAHSEAHNQPSSSSSISSGSHSARSLTTSGTSTSPIDVSAVAVRTPSPSGQGGGNTQFAMRQQRDEQLPPSETDTNTRNGARRAADLAPVNSIDPSGPQAHAVIHEYVSFPPPPANPRSGARRTVRASVDSACTYDHPPPNSPPLDLTTAQSLSASSTEATPATGNQNRSLGSDQDQSRNSDTENDDDLQQRPPAYRSRWPGSRSGNISEEGYEADGYNEDDNSRRRARRNEKSASGSGYALYVPGTGRDGPNVLHVATDDKRVLARLTEAASAPPVSPMAPSFPPEPLSALPPTTTDSDHTHATAPAAPEWEDDVAFYDNLDSPGAGPSNSQSSFLPAPPKAVSSSLAFTSLIPPPALEASSFSADMAFSTSSGSSISGCVPGGSGDDAFIPMETSGPSNPPSSPSPWRPQQFSRYTFAEEELFGAEPEAGPSAPPFTDDAGEDTELKEASAPPLFEDEDAIGDEGLEGRTVTDSPVNRSPDGSANSVEERAIPPAAVR